MFVGKIFSNVFSYIVKSVKPYFLGSFFGFGVL